MSRDKVTITTHQGLLKAFKTSTNIVIARNLTLNKSLIIPPKVKITGATGKEIISFSNEKGGLLLTENNEISNLQIAGAIPQSKVIRYYNSHQVKGNYLLKTLSSSRVVLP